MILLIRQSPQEWRNNMNVQGTVSWVTNNWGQIVELWLQVIGVASIIVKLTPTLKDDDVLKNIVRFVGKYIALNHKAEPKP